MSMPSILVTRPQPDADRTAGHLRALGIEPVIAPMLSMRTIPSLTLDPGRYAAVAITSANALRALDALGQRDTLVGLPLFAVGDHSAHEARLAGFSNVSSAQGTLADLAGLIGNAAPNGPVLYLAGHHQSGDLAGRLAPSGIGVETAVLYEMMAERSFSPHVAEHLKQGPLAGAVFYSRRTAEVFAQLTAGGDHEPLRSRLECLCLSRNCAQPLLESHFLRISLADYPSNEAMMSLALAFAREQISP